MLAAACYPAYMAKPSITALVTDLAATLRDEVLPHLGAHAERAHSGAAEGGDVTFQIDERAESGLEAFLAEARPRDLVLLEDRGLVSPAGDRAEWVLVVDPIDGTRPALAGLRVLLRLGGRRPVGIGTDHGRRAVGCVLELKSGNGFVAERGAGLEARRPAVAEHLPRADVLDLWLPRTAGAGSRRGARDADRHLVASRRHLRPRLGDLRHDPDRDRAARRLCEEPGPRMIDDVPSMRAEFRESRRRDGPQHSPYDLRPPPSACRSAAPW